MYSTVFKAGGGMFVHLDFLRQWLKRLLKPSISIFIIFNIYSLTVMAMPVSWPWKRALLAQVLPVADYLGITHYHNFYSPNPPMSDRRVDFMVVFDDGKSVYWQYPRDKLAFFDRPGSFHRYVQEYLWWGSAYNHAAFPYFASFIIRHLNSLEHRPTEVKFIASEIKTPPPSEPYNLHLQMHKFTFYTYRVAHDL
jgi:hypothetical protein